MQIVNWVSSVIPGDPKPQFKNGKMLLDDIENNGLIVVNGTSALV